MSKKIICLISFVLLLGMAGSVVAAAPPEERIPSNLTSVDIGNPLAGSSQYDPGTDTWTIRADGSDIWDNADHFRYAYKQLSGDGAMVARVVQWTPDSGTNGWRKAGVMIRETLAPGSRHTTMVVTGGSGGGSSLQYRTTTDGTSGNADYTHSPLTPYWVRIARSGNTITGSISADGTTWTQVGSPQTLAAMPTDVYIGLCVTSHEAGLMSTALLDNGPFTASNPEPADGAAVDDTAPWLTWGPGPYAAAVNGHDVYFGENFADVSTGTGDTFKGNQTDPIYDKLSDLVRGTTYYWRIDEVNDLHPAKLWKGKVWSFTVWPFKAWKPNPPDGSKNVDPNGTLSWTKAAGSPSGRQLYFSDDFDKISAVPAGGTGAGVYRKGGTFLSYIPNQDTGNTFRPLKLNKTYYWRVDEKIGTAYNKGDVWRFTTTAPGLGKITREIWQNITPAGATDVASLYNWPAFPYSPTQSDLITPFDSPDQGIDNYGGRIHGWLYPPLTGDYTFYLATDDNGELWLSSDEDRENAVRIAYEDAWADYQAWQFGNEMSAPIHLEDSKRYYIAAYWKEGTGGDHCSVGWTIPSTTNITVIPGSCLAPFVQYQAYNPKPANNAADVERKPTLIWEPGKKAVKHDVYFSDKWDDVNDANTANTSTYPGVYKGRQNLDANSYGPLPTLELGQTYYWRVDEVNVASVWRGNIWQFAVQDYLIVDDFEDYNNTSGNTIIWEKWIKGGGGTVGYSDPNYAELNPLFIHGGRQAMPLAYSNLNPPYYSEASRTFGAPQDWTREGVKALTLWLRGHLSVPPGTFAETPPSSGIYRMTASGADIGDVHDQRPHPSLHHDEFRYAYMQKSGNYAIMAKVESIAPLNADAWAKAGVMIRQSLDPNSAHAMTCLTPSATNGIALQHRAIAGGPSTNDINMPNINPPYWIELDRSGDTFTAYYSPTGATNSWIQFGPTITITMTDPIYYGLSLTSHNTAATCTAVFSDVRLCTLPDYIPVIPLPSLTSKDIGIKSNTVAPLYVALQDSGLKTAMVTYIEEPNAVINTAWQAWDIALRDFTGVDPCHITKMTIGVGNPPQPVGTGTLYIDDIRLYGPRCMSGHPPAADFTSDCFVDYADLAILTDNWLVKPPSGVSSGLKGYWPFNGDLLDSSGNGRNGSDPCGVITYAAGQAGQAASLNGGYVLVGPVGISGAAARTIAGWAKASTMSMPTAAWINVFGFTSRSGTLTNTFFDIEKWGNGNAYAIHVNGWEREILPVDLEWHHLAGSYDGTTIRWYGDGQFVGEDSSRVLDTNDLVHMGMRADNNNRFQGLIDEVRIYNRALSLAEIEYLAGKPMIDINKDGSIDFKDYTILADMWLEELLWPQ